jgi:integrase
MLTVNQIKALPTKKSAYYKPDNTGERGTGRLTVQVTPAGSKIFKFKYHKEKKEVFVTLGKFPALTLSQARELAKEYSAMLSQGLDPKDELEKRSKEQEQHERAENALGTFEQLIDFHTEYKGDKGNRTQKQEYKLIKDNVFPFLDIQKKAKDFETEDFLDILATPIEQGFVDKSNKIRSILHAAFNFALGYENNPKFRMRATKFGIENNPIANIPKQPEKVGTHYMTWEEVSQFLHDMDHRYKDLGLEYLTRQALKMFFHLYGQRPYEVLTLAWDQVDYTNRTVLIIEDFHKKKKNHLVPLTDSAMNILQDIKENTKDINSPFIFFNTANPAEHMDTNTTSKAILTYKKATKIRPFTARDIRRTTKTLGGEAKIPKEFRDRIHGHAINDVSGKHYDLYEYLDEKREWIEVWEKALLKHLKDYQKAQKQKQ